MGYRGERYRRDRGMSTWMMFKSEGYRDIRVQG